MILTFEQLQKILPELNKKVITPTRLFEVFNERGIEFHELTINGDGCYVHKDDKDYVILKYALQQLLFHETLAHEGTHALAHYPAEFLLRKHQLEAEAFSLIMMMPLTELPRLNRIKHQLDEESYELVKRRNKINEVWGL